MSRSMLYAFWSLFIAVHTWLFYEESLGLNGLIFSMVLVSFLTWYHQLQTQRIWWLGAGGHLISALAVFWHGDFTSSLMYYLSSLVVAGLMYSPKGSLPVLLLNGLLGSIGSALVASVPVLWADMRKSLAELPFVSGITSSKAYLYVAPATVSVLFYLLYYSANPDFFLDISFPDFELNFKLAGYVFMGVIITAPFFFPWGLAGLVECDKDKVDVLKRYKSQNKGSKAMGLAYENLQGRAMFGMLNLLISIFLVFNMLQVFIPQMVRNHSNHSQQVHQGFETLMISIVIAILLMMYYFRGNQNFYSGRARLIRMAMVWILLNGLLALFTCYKNMLYVDLYGLTYKRIWVFIGIVLTAIGLLFTFYKIQNLKTNWYLLRRNAWTLYFVLALYGIADWDRVIVWYNVNFAEELDMAYITSLGTTTLPYLTDRLADNDPRIEVYRKRIDEKVLSLQLTRSSWQSQTLDDVWLRQKLVR